MFLNLKGQQIYYQTVGKGKNLILLHGWRQDVSTWWGVVDSLKDEFKLWLVDMPGFGRSDLPKKPWTISDYADCITSFIQNRKISQPILLGHSLGGNVAIKLAAKHPNLIHKLILEDSSGIRPQKTVQSAIFFVLAKVIKYLIPNLFNLRERIRFRFYSAIGSDYLIGGDLKTTLQNILAEDIEQDAKKINTETLILWGENDSTVPLKVGKKLYQLIKNARFEMIEEVNHFPHLENPMLFNYYVKDFS